LKPGIGQIVLIAIVAFAATLGGVVLGHKLVPTPDPASKLHELVHDGLDLDPRQRILIDRIEADYKQRHAAFHADMQRDNRMLGQAFQEEQAYGPRVADAVDKSHAAMGDMQKATLQQLFAVRRVLRPDQAAKFDRAVVRALDSSTQ
jgi:hypothetical protein